MFENWNKLSEDNKVKLIIVILTAALASIGYLVKNWIETSPKQEFIPVKKAPLMILSGADSIEGDVHIINFKPPNNTFSGALKNTGDALLEFEEQSFPDDFFFLTLWDSDLNIPAHSKLNFSIIFKNSVPDRVEYPFELTYNNRRDKVKMLIRVAGNWSAYLQSQLDQFNKKVADETSPQQHYKAAKEVLAQNNEGLDESLKEALTGQFLTQAGHLQAASIAYFHAEKMNYVVAKRFVNNPEVINALAQFHKDKGDFKEAAAWYNLAAERGDLVAQESLNELTTLIKNTIRHTDPSKIGSKNAPSHDAIKKSPHADDGISFLLVYGNCRYCDLSSAKLRGANLKGADLIGAKLIGADLSGADLREALLSGADLSGADLSGAKLSGAHLSGSHLSGANLRGTRLRGAHLGGADLRGTDVGTADLNGVDLTGAIR